jgi:hypothetical protein
VDRFHFLCYVTPLTKPFYVFETDQWVDRDSRTTAKRNRARGAQSTRIPTLTLDVRVPSAH